MKTTREFYLIRRKGEAYYYRGGNLRETDILYADRYSTVDEAEGWAGALCSFAARKGTREKIQPSDLEIVPIEITIEEKNAEALRD
jgi:hypothetical protein